VSVVTSEMLVEIQLDSLIILSYDFSEYTHYGAFFGKDCIIYRSTDTPVSRLLLSSCGSIPKCSQRKKV
jgi:hypothetical protein